MISRESNKLNLCVLPNGKKLTIHPIMHRLIEKQSIIVTDGYAGYWGLDEHFTKHVQLNIFQGIRRSGKFNMGKVEGFFSTIKRAIIGQYHQLSKKHLQEYMDEIAFKKNFKNDDLFKTLMKMACAVF